MRRLWRAWVDWQCRNFNHDWQKSLRMIRCKRCGFVSGGVS